MANFKYFIDRPDGTTEEVSNVSYLDRNDKTVAGYNGRGHYVYLGKGQYEKVSRVVRYKAFPSKHECDARCLNAQGKTMNCECKCGGKNHGKGA